MKPSNVRFNFSSFSISCPSKTRNSETPETPKTPYTEDLSYTETAFMYE